MDLSNVNEITIPEGYVLEIHSTDGVIWRKPSSYTIWMSPGGLETAGDSDEGWNFNIQGTGDIVIGGFTLMSVDYAELTFVSIASETLPEGVTQEDGSAFISFVGKFQQISTTAHSTTSTSVKQGSIKQIVSWDSNINYTYPQMLYYQAEGSLITPISIPSWITKISNKTFYYYNGTSLNIPAQINEIGAQAFAYINANNTVKGLSTIYFNQPAGMEITLPAAGSGTGMGYSKSAYELTVYTDNEYIKNYDWATDNATVTFYHLDGTIWEE